MNIGRVCAPKDQLGDVQSTIAGALMMFRWLRKGKIVCGKCAGCHVSAQPAPALAAHIVTWLRRASYEKGKANIGKFGE